jgi:uncharacterized membrane protein
LIGVIIISTIALIYALAPSQSKVQYEGVVTIAEVKTIIETHCVSCHSVNPTDEFFVTAPNGFMLNTEEQIIASKNQIYQRAVATNTMPLGNKTNMTSDERQKLKAWIEAE